MHGHGKYTFFDGLVYEGEFRSNHMTGHGVLTWCVSDEGVRSCDGGGADLRG